MQINGWALQDHGCLAWCVVLLLKTLQSWSPARKCKSAGASHAGWWMLTEPLGTESTESSKNIYFHKHLAIVIAKMLPVPGENRFGIQSEYTSPPTPSQTETKSFLQNQTSDFSLNCRSRGGVGLQNQSQELKHRIMYQQLGGAGCAVLCLTLNYGTPTDSPKTVLKTNEL